MTTGDSRFTAILDEDHAGTFDRIKTAARVHLHRHVSKADLLRALIDLVADDDELRARVFELVGGVADLHRITEKGTAA